MDTRRMEVLLKSAGRELKAGQDVFGDRRWLQKHNVRLDELLALADFTAALYSAYLAASPKLRTMLLMLSAMHDSEQKPELIKIFMHEQLLELTVSDYPNILLTS